MAYIEIANRTQASTLHLELLASDALLHARDVHPSDVGNELNRVGKLCALAYSTAIHSRGELEFHEEYEPKLVQARYGSPLEIVLGVPYPILEYVAAISLLIYGAKRLWGVPLEFKTHNKEMLKRFHDASREALEAEQRHEIAIRKAEHARMEPLRSLEVENPEPSLTRRMGAVETGERRAYAKREEEFSEIDKERRWRSSSASEIEKLRTEDWVGRSGTWLVEDD